MLLAHATRNRLGIVLRLALPRAAQALALTPVHFTSCFHKFVGAQNVYNEKMNRLYLICTSA